MMKNKRVSLVIGVLTLLYLTIDIFHFFLFRLEPVYPTFTEAFYESIIVSIIKWVLCVLIIAGLVLDKKDKALSFYLIFVSIIGIALLFILKGQLNYLIRGSIVHNVGLLEISMLPALYYSIFIQTKKYNIKFSSIIIILILTVLVLSWLFYQLPVYNNASYD
jgi:hypothetical protein